MRLSSEVQLPQNPDTAYSRELVFQLKTIFRALTNKLNGIADGRLSAIDSTGTAAPTTGTWAQGDQVRNSNPTELAESVTAATLLNSWVNYDTATYNAAGYYRDNAGLIRLRGLVKSGVVGSPILTLPTGYRPAKEEIFSVVSNNAFGRVDVFVNGDVTLLVGSNAFASLDGISFLPASGPGKYVIDGWLDTAGGTPGTWVQKRFFTGN